MTRMKLELLLAEVYIHKMYFSWKQAQKLLDQYPDLEQLPRLTEVIDATAKQIDLNRIFSTIRATA